MGIADIMFHVPADLSDKDRANIEVLVVSQVLVLSKILLRRPLNSAQRLINSPFCPREREKSGTHHLAVWSVIA